MATKVVCSKNIDGEFEANNIVLTAQEEQAIIDEQNAEVTYKASAEYEEEQFTQDIEKPDSNRKLKRLLFEINFDQENRIRALEAKAPITKAQYRNAIKTLWQSLP